MYYDTCATAKMGLLPLTGALLLLMLDSAIEMALLSSMVGYLHRSGANKYPFDHQGTSVTINAKPAGLMVNQGHTSNGAAGTALVGIVFGGFIVLWLQRRRQAKSTSRGPGGLFLAYTIFTILSALLALAALAYTFAVTNQTKGQKIDQTIAAQVEGHAYPKDKWTPETWTKAMIALPLTSDKDAKYLKGWVKVMDGWKWNLIPLFLIGSLVAVLTVREYLRQSRQSRNISIENRDEKTAL